MAKKGCTPPNKKYTDDICRRAYEINKKYGISYGRQADRHPDWNKASLAHAVSKWLIKQKGKGAANNAGE